MLEIFSSVAFIYAKILPVFFGAKNGDLTGRKKR